MDKKEMAFLRKLLAHPDKSNVKFQVENASNSLFLNSFAANYNWNNGFDIPMAILRNETCDFGTGLLMFHDADGYRMLVNFDEVSSSSYEEWKGFLAEIYKRLVKLEFQSQNISFDPELTKVQKYKLKKSYLSIPDILISKSPGEVVHIPKINGD